MSIADNSVAVGGTALNVAEAARALGWNSSVVGQIGTDPAGRLIHGSLEANGVDVSQLLLNGAWRTPVLLQSVDAGEPRYHFSCPHCGTRFATHRPAPATFAREIILSHPVPDVFFFDRASLFTLTLASGWSELGSLVVFEPSGLGRPQIFDRAVALANIIKYSSNRGDSFENRLPLSQDQMIIRTSGSAGMDYWLRGRWFHSSAPSTRTVVDTAGAGDWTSAGLIDSWHRSGEAMSTLSVRSASSILSNAQRLGALATGWSGARPPGWPVVHAPRRVDYRFYCPQFLSASSA